jgi:ribose 5-phosphate isomerase A
MSPSPTQEASKRAAALQAAMAIEDGMVVGLGSGSTAALAVEALAARIAQGLRVVGIPTSEATAALARRLGVPLTSFAEHSHVDITIDGADQVERRSLTLIKGRGGALLREKIVAFGSQTVIARLKALGCAPTLRLKGDEPFFTDGGNLIADCAMAEIPDPAALEARLAAVTGVIETGLFIGLATEILIGRPAGVELLQR